MIQRVGDDLWKAMPDGNEKRQMYYCSREWGVKKEAVKKRSGGTCERCHCHPAENVHHRTYARLYVELLSDLWHLCSGCHENQHAKGPDPLDEVKQALIAPRPAHLVLTDGTSVSRDGWSLLRCPLCGGEQCHITSVEDSTLSVYCESHHEFKIAFDTDKGHTFVCTRDLKDCVP